MTPQDIAADLDLLVPFLAAVGHLSPLPSESLDLDVLLSQDGTRVIAALWPQQEYDAQLDLSPERFKRLTPEEDLNLTIQHRDTVADRMGRLLEMAASASGRSLEDVKTHLEWSTAVSSRELQKLLNGHDTFSFSVVVDICEALHLDFDDDWVVRDAGRLGRRVDRSLLAAQIARKLHFLPTETLEGLWRRLPRGSANADQAFDESSHKTAPPTGRYKALYKALSSETKDAPVYSLSDIDEILVAGGESPLPPNARQDRSWWAGSGAKAKGRPQVRAWWAAGYRIQKIRTEPDTGRVTSILFDCLPDRTQGNSAADRAGMASTTRGVDAIDKEPKINAHMSSQPDDADIRDLKEFLESHGEADRGQIEKWLRQDRRVPFDDPWLTNLLTRARRQGWIVRYGTRSRPRWVAAGSAGDQMLKIASLLDFDFQPVRPGAVPQEFLQIVAERLGIPVPLGASLVDLVRAIVESVDQRWEAGFVSTSGQEIQPRGMEAVLRAAQLRH